LGNLSDVVTADTPLVHLLTQKKKEEKQISSPHLLQTLTIEQIAIVALSWACLQL